MKPRNCHNNSPLFKIQRAFTSRGKIGVLTKSHRTLEEITFLTQLVARVQFIKIQRRKATHRKIGKLTKVRQHLGSLYLFAQCHSSCSFLLFDIFFKAVRT
ncbi:hypothetical protein D3829_08090 [Streptococcus mutans]|nr:hypothetical protein [Streptococcus mutans]